MAAGTLYTYPNSFRANKVLIAAQYSGASVKVDGSFKLGETNKSDAFLKKFPNGKVPAFEGGDGFCLTESNAIAYYVSSPQLHGEGSQAAAQIQQWISYSDNEILPAACTWVFPCLGITQFNKQDTENAKTQVKRVLGLLNNHLLTKTFLVGERVTLADISVACNLQSLYEMVLDGEFRKPFQNVNRWYTTVMNQPEFKKVLGDVKLCTKMAVFDNNKYQELHGAKGGAGDQKKKQDKKQPQQQPKKAAPAPAAAEPEEEPKKDNKDPFAALPKGTMNLDEFKREYSNKDIVTEAIPYFWKNLDTEAYSIWTCEYLFNDSLKGKMDFMVSNLIDGMYQRLDKFRKNSFGVMFVLGEPYTIKGLWFWRSQDLGFTLSPDWQVDYESYKWTKLDPASEETKKLVTTYFTEGNSCNLQVDGLEVVDSKVFK